MATNEAEQYFETEGDRKRLTQPITLKEYWRHYAELQRAQPSYPVDPPVGPGDLSAPPPSLDMNREQDDPKPGLQSVTDCVISDLQARRIASIPKYGSELKTHNGRNPMLDAYQELLDLTLYIRQLLAESLFDFEVPDPPKPEEPKCCPGTFDCDCDLFGGICG